MNTVGIEKNAVLLHISTATAHQVVAIPVAIDEATNLVDRTTEGEFYFLRKVGFAEITRHPIKQIETDFRPFISSITLGLVAEPPTPTLFPLHQTLVCATTGAKFGVMGLPDQYRIELTGEPAYAYCGYHLEADGSYSTLRAIHVCCQKDMEDGRFIIADQDYERKTLNLRPMDGLQDYPRSLIAVGVETKASIVSLTHERTRGTP